MSLEELSQQKIVTYESFVEFLKRQSHYSLYEDIAKVLYDEYVDERKCAESHVSSFHKMSLKNYSILYEIRAMKRELRKRFEERFEGIEKSLQGLS